MTLKRKVKVKSIGHYKVQLYITVVFKNWMLILVLLCENERQRWDTSRYIKARSEVQLYVLCNLQQKSQVKGAGKCHNSGVLIKLYHNM